jgi:hypothetical protein
VEFRRSFGDPQLPGDLFIGPFIGEQAKHLCLATS